MDDAAKRHCSTCHEPAGFYCNGCNRVFCPSDAAEHRQSLYEQLDWITADHDDLAQKLNQTPAIVQRKHPSRTVIDQWEEESIKQIRQTANEARHALNDVLRLHLDEVKAKLNLLTDKLNEVCQKGEGIFDERNIQQWAAELRAIKQELTTTSNFTVRIHGNKPVVMPVIKIQAERPAAVGSHPPKTPSGLVSIKPTSGNPFETLYYSTQGEKSIDEASMHSIQKDDRFHIKSSHMKTHDGGHIAVHDATQIDASVRGLNEYSHGEHKLFFRIESLPANEWMFFGVVSKQGSFDSQAYTDPSAHGWTGYNNVYINGKPMPVLNGFISEMQVNDYVELTIDCTREVLYLWHSRQTYKNKLPVDTQTCPFPWQFLISCHNANDSVRILPMSIGSLIKREQYKLNNEMRIKEIAVTNGADRTAT